MMEGLSERCILCRFQTFSNQFSVRSVPDSRIAKLDSVQDLRTGGRGFDPRARSIFCSRTDDKHCDRIHSSLTSVHCFDDC